MHFIFSRCPELKALYLPSVMRKNSSFVLLEVISKWKNLELLKLGSPYSVNMENILEEISLHCKNFCHLEIVIIELFWRNIASAVVTFLPYIKYSESSTNNLFKFLYCLGSEQFILLFSYSHF